MSVLKNIHIKLQHTDKNVNINLDGKNLIIVGGNGCGKTQLLNQIKDAIERALLINRKGTIEVITEEITNKRRYLKNSNPHEQIYHIYTREIAQLEEELQVAQRSHVNFFNLSESLENFTQRTFIYRFFKDDRRSAIKVENQSTSLSGLVNQTKSSTLDQDFGLYFENYLVSMRHQSNEILARESDKTEANIIDDWFSKIELDLQYLFEDDNLMLLYNREEQSFYISQFGKNPFRFNELSSGFSAIMSIYSDLLTKIRINKIEPDDFEGIVLIDEICAHLHVSLQRKIFKFFTDNFPKVQFIVTTHSPFVIQSVNDALIYDLKTDTLIDEDLSFFSYESIIKGLLDTPNNSSELVALTADLAKELDKLEECDLTRVKAIVDELMPSYQSLDVEVRALIQSALLKLDF